MYPSRWCCLPGVCFRIDCLQRITSFGEVLLTMTPGCVWQGVILSNLLVHLFLHCNSFGSVWHLIYSWIDVSMITPFYVPAHFHQFSFCGCADKRRRSVLQVIWFATLWEIWKERNSYLTTKKTPFIRWLIRLSLLHLYG